jgi:hypothetical protein
LLGPDLAYSSSTCQEIHVVNSLRSIIATILADLTCAQNSANELSASLSRKYRVHPLLKFFPVPNALLDEADITLRLAFDGTPPGADGTPCAPPAPPEAMRPSRLVAAELARQVSNLISRRLAKTAVTDLKAPPGIAENTLLPPSGFREGLAHRLIDELDEMLATQPGESPIAPDLNDRIVTHIRLAFLQSVSGFPELTRLFPDAPSLADRLLDTPTQSECAEMFLRSLSQFASIAALTSSLPSMHVMTSASEIASLPEYAVHTVRIRAQLRNYRWIIVDPNDPRSQQLTVEN